MTYAVLSDLHCHDWTAFDKPEPNGTSGRLCIILGELRRAATELTRAGGNTMVIAGDIFHVRGSLDPEVLNPVQETVRWILDSGIDIHAIPGNHDLKGKETTELGSAIQTLTQTFSMNGVFRVYNEPKLLYDASSSKKDRLAFVPWRSTVDTLLTNIEALAKLAGGDIGTFDLFIHAGIDGVLTGMPEHGLTAKKLASYGFKRVFAGHYHNRKDLGDNVWSIGATTHQHWGDIGTKAGFLLVDDDDVRVFDSNAPKFVDVSGMNEDDAALAADGNYVRFRGQQMSTTDVAELRKFFEESGALGVSIQASKPVVNGRTGSPSATGIRTIDQSVSDFVDQSKNVPAHIDRNVLKQRCADILATSRAVTA